LFSTNSELVSRLPSAIFAIILVQALFIFLKRAGFSAEQALLSSLLLLTSPLFLQLSSAAEIDLTFSALISFSLFYLFLSSQSNKSHFAILAYVLCGLAALTKGPVAIGIVFLVDSCWVVLNWKVTQLSRLIVSRMLGLLTLLLVLSTWLYPVLLQVNSDQLFQVLGSEITRRFNSVSARESKGPLFYLESILLGTFPWSAIAVYSVIKFRRSIRELFDLAIYKFAFLCSGLILLALSFAHGKASRYSLPVYPFLAIIFSPLVQAAIHRYQPNWGKKKIYYYLTGTIIFLTFISCLYFPTEIVSISAGSFFFLFSIYLIQQGSKKILPISLSICLLLIIISRFGETICYSQYRNKTKSIVPDVVEIAKSVKDSSLPKQIYALELVERWYAYYLERFGVSLTLLQPESLNRISPEQQIFLILSKKDELWRIPQIFKSDPNSRQIPTLDKSQVVFLSTSGKALASLRLQSGFPTDLTTPEQ